MISIHNKIISHPKHEIFYLILNKSPFEYILHLIHRILHLILNTNASESKL